MYGAFRPKNGISLMGEKKSGPIPSACLLVTHQETDVLDLHPMTYKDKPSDALL